MDRVKIGNTFRAIRVAMRLRQADVAARAGVSQQTVSNLECGRFGGFSVDTFCRVAGALDADVPMAPRWRGPKLERILDRRHALLQNRAAELVAGLGWEVRTELSFNHYGDRGSVDVLGWRPDRDSLLIVEIKTEIASLEETLRVLDMKSRVVPIIARREHGWQPRCSATVLVMPDASTHRRLVERHSSLVSASLPERTWAVRHWLAEPSGQLRGVLFLANTGPRGTKSKVPTSRRVRAARNASGEPPTVESARIPAHTRRREP
jgi:transcriptional regulator with XRE-family HTH domain